MAQADIIREFLVSLGFKSDEKSLKKFTDGIEGATKGVTKLVTTISGAALTVGAGVAAFAANMEALYFASMKTGASATNLKAFEKSAQNFGVASGEALASVQNLARWMRETPAAEGFLRSLGVEARDANGNLKDTTEIMAGLGDSLRAKPYYLAKQYAQMLGISEDVLRAMLRGDFEAEMAKQREALVKGGYDEAAEKAHKFMIRLRELQTQIEAIGVVVGTYLLDAMERIEPFVMPILKTIAEGWKNIYDWVTAAGKAIGNILPESWRDKIGAGTAWLLDKLGIRGAVDSAMGIGGSGISSNQSAGLPGSKVDPMRYFVAMGWSKEQAAGIVANLRAESGMNPNISGDNGKAYGIAQWHPDRQANFAKWSGKDIKGSSLYEQLAFVNYELTQGSHKRVGELLRASRNSAQAGEIVSRQYEVPSKANEEAAKRAASAVTIAQNTTINVNGGDAAATGRAVAGEQNQVNQTMARNMQTALN